jgi:hypothetical protein
MNIRISAYMKEVKGELLAENDRRFTFVCSRGYALGIVPERGEEVKLYDRSVNAYPVSRLPLEGIFFKRSGEFLVRVRGMVKPDCTNAWSDAMLDVARKTIAKLE